MSEKTASFEPVENGLNGLTEKLKSAGLVPESMEIGLRCAKMVGALQVGWTCFVSAERILGFGPEEHTFKDQLTRLQEQLFGDKFFVTPRPALYLYVIGSAENIQALDDRGLSFLLENDMNYAEKWIGTLATLEAQLDSLFPTAFSASATSSWPSVRLLKELRDRAATEAVPTKALTPYTRGAQATEQALLAKERAAERNLIAKTYARFMGRDFNLAWTNSGVAFGRAYMPGEGVPRVSASRGEQAGFDLACFLAEAATTAVEGRPDTAIGLHGVLTAFDSLTRVRVLDVLREFVVATGVSLEIQTANTSLLGLAKARLQPVAAIAGLN